VLVLGLEISKFNFKTKDFSFIVKARTNIPGVRVSFRVRLRVRVEVRARLRVALFLGIFSRRKTCTVNISDCRYISHTAKLSVTGTIYTAIFLFRCEFVWFCSNFFD